MAGSLPYEFTDWVASLAFTPENIARANDFLSRQRGIDPAQLRCAFALTGPGIQPWECLREWRQPFIFTESLFIPVFDGTKPDLAHLAGFDIRYCGAHPHRTRFLKIKRSDPIPLFFNLHEAMRHPCCIVTEAALDTQTALQVIARFPEETRKLVSSMSPLTALGTPQFAMMLYGLFDRVLLAFDNDTNGQTQGNRLIEAAERAGPDVARVFSLLSYSGKDFNSALTMLGADMLGESIIRQL